MPRYRATFRLGSESGSEKRYDAMLDAMMKIRDGSWGEPTSFWLFSSSLPIEAATKAIAKPLKPERDLLVICDLETNRCCYFGVFENPDIFREYFPSAKKMG
jgi:hypothetical protein